jgi:hypothetical protein
MPCPYTFGSVVALCDLRVSAVQKISDGIFHLGGAEKTEKEDLIRKGS